MSTPVGTDDIVNSLRRHILTKVVSVKTATGFTEETLFAAYPDLNVMPRGLDYSPNTSGPRIGIRPTGHVVTDTFMGEGAIRRWRFLLEVDALMRSANQAIDVDLSARTMFRLDAALRQLLKSGSAIPCSIWGASNTPIADGGYLQISEPPRFHQVSDDGFGVSLSLSQCVDE